jgi:hypothetical protein
MAGGYIDKGGYNGYEGAMKKCAEKREIARKTYTMVIKCVI